MSKTDSKTDSKSEAEVESEVNAASYKLEALKMVKEWCTWLAGLQTGICALLWDPLKKALEARASDIAVLHWGWFAFLLSLLLTVLLLSRLPGMIERLGKNEDQNKSVFDKGLFAGKYFNLRIALWIIHITFAAGAILVGIVVWNRWVGISS
jgi:hypothetical protein